MFAICPRRAGGTISGVASNVELIIFDSCGSLSAALPAGAVAVGLLGGLAGILVTDELLAALASDADDDDRVHPGWMLKQRVCRLARDLSASRRVLYVAGETFGGLCCQEAVGWHGGRLVHGPSGTCAHESDREVGYRVLAAADSAINAGLRMMGVRAAGGLDEYAAAGLDRHRFTADWREE
jgi:hypothetical protein